MRLRKLALAVGLAGVLSAEMASALGLGEIKLLSTLNQPLEAEIKLLQANDLSENEILIGLAANEDFKRAGIDRLYFLTDLKFTVQLDRASGPVIRVSSKKPVREPYLNFLLETQWPNGRILREYTLLMDLPVFSDDNVRPVESARSSTTRATEQPRQARTIPKPPQTNQAEEASSVEPQESRASRARTQSQSSGSEYGADVYGPVGANDTLWEIALKVRPTRGHSVQQTMLAIQRLNPEAFINGNINLLRKGQVLRVPDSSDIDAVTARQAVSEVAYQNNQWSDTSGSRSTKAQLDGSKRRSTAQTEQQSVSGRLKVAGAEARENLEAGRAAGEVGGDVESLQNDLAISLEELDRSRRENSELQDRVGELEDQIQTMERLLEVSSQELRALQLGAKDNQQAASATEAEGEVFAQVEESSADDESSASVESMAEEAVTAEQAQTAPESVAKTEAKKPDPSKVVRRAKPPEPSFMDMIMDNILYIGGGLVAVLAGAFLFLRRRKEDEQEDDVKLSYDEPVASDVPADDEDPFASIDEPEQDQEAIEQESIFAEESELDLDDVVPTESQTGDAVGEADIYIAYGKFDQAEEMLLNALSENHHDTAARLKLMEVYVETQDLQKFDEQYAAVQADGNPDTMARASDLREQFDNAPAYIDMPAEDAASVQQDDLHELGDTALAEDDSFDFDLGDDSDAASDTELTLDEDFGLNFESNLTGEPEPQETAAEESEEFTLDISGDDDLSSLDDELSFDLDLGDDTVDAQSENVTEELDLELDSAATDESDLSLDLGDNELSLDLDESSFDGGDLELDLETDSGKESAEAEFDLDTGLDADALSLDGEAPTLDLDSADLSSDEAPVDSIDLDLSLDESESLAADSDLDSAFELDVDSAENTEDELELAVEGLDIEDLDADLASLDSELSGDDADAEAELASPTEAEDFDLSLDDNSDAFDVDMDGIDLDTLDQEVDALAADLDVSEADESTVPEDIEAAADFDLSFEETPSVEVAEEASEDSVSFDSEELSLDEGLDLDMDVPTLEADLSDGSAAVEAEPEFDLAADLGLSADDMEGADQASDDEMFTEALSDLPTPEDVMADDGMTDEDLDAELDFLADTDEAATKLDLARAYIDMGDQDGAKDILDEVVQEGNDDQKQQAEELLSRMS